MTTEIINYFSNLLLGYQVSWIVSMGLLQYIYRYWLVSRYLLREYQTGCGCLKCIIAHNEFLQFWRGHLEHLQIWTTNHRRGIHRLIESQPLWGILTIEIQCKWSLETPTRCCGWSRCELGIFFIEWLHVVGIISHFHSYRLFFTQFPASLTIFFLLSTKGRLFWIYFTNSKKNEAGVYFQMSLWLAQYHVIPIFFEPFFTF